MRKGLMIALLSALLLAACGGEVILPAPTNTASPAIASAIAEPTAFEPTPTPDPDVILTPTPIVEPGGIITDNKIANPNFTGGATASDQYVYTAPDGTEVPGVPAEWFAWADTSAGIWPEFGPEQHPAHHFPDDWQSWKIHATYSTFRGGLWQQFTDLQPGFVYSAWCWMFAYAGDLGGQGYPSTGWVNMRLGIDPFGGTDPDAASVLWSVENANMIRNVANVIDDEYDAYDLFDPYQVMFTADSATATLWIEASIDFAYPSSTAWVDSCAMHALGPEWVYRSVEPTPAPTPEPAPDPLPDPYDGIDYFFDPPAIYLPYVNVNVRPCTDTENPECAREDVKPANSAFLVYAADPWPGSDEVWLCIDPACNAFVAFMYEGVEYGYLEFVE